VVESVGSGVSVLGRIERGIVAVQSGKHMALSFHPELGGDLRLHRMFLGKI
jgi:5'-phosphate synthase pdxT subunit